MFQATLLVFCALLGLVFADGLTCENNQSNGTTYTAANGGVYDVLCGIDFFGGDLDAVAGVTFQQCVEACDSATGCVDIAFVEGGGNCYMKNRLTPAISNANVWSALKHSAVNSTSSVDVSCNTPGTNGTTFTATTGSTYRILCGLDYGGGDLTSTQTSDFAGCIEACENNDACIDVSYVNGACYMKNILNPPTALDYVWTAEVLKSNRTGGAVIPLSCNEPSVNETTYTTSGNRVYQILCGVDYLAGDMSSTTAPTFELCMEACDAADGCIDVSYVAPSCYLKNTLGTTDAKSWVWNARFMAPAVTTTSPGFLPTATYGNSTLANATTGATASLPTSTACAANTTTFYPAANQVNGSDYSILDPENQITLTYIDPNTLRVLALDFSMNLPTVVLEDSNYIDDVSCGPNMQVSLTDETSYNIATSWPTSGFLVVTYFPGCNDQTQRGVYYVSNITPFPLDLIVGLDVVEVNITDVATEMSIEFGTLVNTATSLTSTCTASLTGTGAPTPTTFQPPSTTSLSPEAKAIMDSLKSLLKYDANGNILATVPMQAAPAIVTPDPFNPNDLAAQAALQAALADAGLASPDAVAAQIAGALAGTCTNSSIAALPARKAKAKRLIATPQKPVRPHQLVARKKGGGGEGGEEEEGAKYGSAGGGGDPDGWDYACDDTVTGFADMFGAVGELYDGVCAGHDAYQAGSAIDCMVKHCDETETWYTTTSYYIYYPPPSTIYSFLNSWTITYPSLSTYPLGFARDGSKMTCFNCNMAVNLIQFDGAITVNLTSKQVQNANINAGISWDADHVINVDSNGPWTSTFNYVFNADSFDGIGVAGIFSVTPSMIYSIAYSWSTDSAVNFTAGAHLHVGNATANMNALSGGSVSVQDPTVFSPVPTFIYPVFSTGSKVSMSLVMQALVSMSVNIMGQISITTSQTIQNTVGMSSQYSTTAGSCPANNLAVNSFVSTNNTISINGGVANNLYQNQIAGQPRCFAVPNAVPNPEDIVALASVGGPYCSSYISYSPPTSSTVSTTTQMVPSTVTTTVTATVTNTPLVTIYPTYRNSLTSTSVLLSSTKYVYTQGTYSIPSQYLKRDLASTPSPTTEREASNDRALARRQVAAPTMISGWSPAKISYACSQIATGAVTTTYTATVTRTSGYTTSTQTNTVNAHGPVSTVTYGTYESLIVTTVTVTNPGVATSTVATACPLQTSETCLRIFGHGAPQFEGWPMAYEDSADSNFQFGTDQWNKYTEWYLASDGSLYALESDQPWAVTGNYALGGWVIIGRASQSNGYAHAKCTKNCVSKTITCCAMGTCTWSSSPVNTQEDWYYSSKSIQPYLPSWGFVQREGFAYPLTLTYEDIQCPCRY